MPSESVPGDPGRDDDLAWLDRDPMTAEEREASLERLCEQDGPPGGYGTWRLRTPGPGPDLTVTLEPLTTDPCDHRYEAKVHDPGIKLRHLAQVRHATCTSPACRRPAAQHRRPVRLRAQHSV